MRRGFTLAEVMVALLFISIALFAYVSLHIRIIHSSARVEERQTHREAAQASLSTALPTLATSPESQPENVTVERGVLGVGQLSRVRVEVVWKDREGVQRIEATTLVGPEDASW